MDLIRICNILHLILIELRLRRFSNRTDPGEMQEGVEVLQLIWLVGVSAEKVLLRIGLEAGG